jgi:hypothetical protein
MQVYGLQLAPLLETLVRYGVRAGIAPNGSFHTRAMWRGSLGRWLAEGSGNGEKRTGSSEGGGE